MTAASSSPAAQQTAWLRALMANNIASSCTELPMMHQPSAAAALSPLDTSSLLLNTTGESATVSRRGDCTYRIHPRDTVPTVSILGLLVLPYPS